MNTWRKAPRTTSPTSSRRRRSTGSTTSSTTPCAKKFVDAFYDRYKTYPSNGAECAYVNIMVYKAAVEQAHSTDPAKLIPVLENMQWNFTKGPEHFRKEDHQGVNSCLVVEGIRRPTAAHDGFAFAKVLEEHNGPASWRRSTASHARWKPPSSSRSRNGHGPAHSAAPARFRSFPYHTGSRGRSYASPAQRARPRSDLRRDRRRADDRFRYAAAGQFRARRVLRDRRVRRARRRAAIGASAPAFVAAPIAVALFAVVLDRLLLRPFYDKDATSQILVTFGIALIVEETLRLIFGATTQQYPPLPRARHVVLARTDRLSRVPPAVRRSA